MRTAAVALAGWVSGCAFGAIGMGLFIANQEAKKSANLYTINGVKITLEDANKIVEEVKKNLANSMREKGEKKMRSAAIYENKDQWGGCSNYLEASALFFQASEWGDASSRELEKTAFDAGKRACDRWYGHEGT